METQELAIKRPRDEEEEKEQNIRKMACKVRSDEDRDFFDESQGSSEGENKGMEENIPEGRQVNQGIEDRSRPIPDNCKFVYMKSMEPGTPMTKVNPFRVTEAIGKVIQGDIKSVKPLKSGDLIIEAESKNQIEGLCSIRNVVEIPVNVIMVHTYNTVRGVIYEPSLCVMQEREIVEALGRQNVVNARFINKGPNKVRTPLVILTFEGTILPYEVKCGYRNVKVEEYIPPPMRCYKCNGFGHTTVTCINEMTCVKCGGNHKRENCSSDQVKCTNCGSSEHEVLDRSCPAFKREKEIIEIKCVEKTSYYVAKKKWEQKSYAEAAAPKKSSQVIAAGGTNGIKGNGANQSNKDIATEKSNGVKGNGGKNDGKQGKGGNKGAKPKEIVQKGTEEEISLENGAVNLETVNQESEHRNDEKQNIEEICQDEVVVIGLLANLNRIITRNPGKATIQARQIVNLFMKSLNKKLDVNNVIRALQ